MIAEGNDAMRLLGSGKTATQVLQGLEGRRRANGGWVVPWPRPPETFANARMEEAAIGSPQPNKDLRELQDYFLAIFEAGGSPDDLRKAFTTWPTVHPARMAKGPMQNFLDPLIRRANICHLELAAKSVEETAPERAATVARSMVANAEHRLSVYRDNLTRARTYLTQTEGSAGGIRRYAEQGVVDAECDVNAAVRTLADAERALKHAERAIEVRP